MSWSKSLTAPLLFTALCAGSQNVGINNNAPRFPLSFSTALGDKISLWDNGLPAADNFGIGIQSGLLQIHTYASTDDIALGYGSSINFNEKFRFKGNGNMGIGNNNPAFLLDVSGRIRLRNDASNSVGVYFNNQANTNLAGFVGMLNDSYVGLWGGSGSGFGLVMNTANGNTGIGNNNPSFLLDVNGRIRLRNDASNSPGVFFNNLANTSLAGFVGMMNDSYVGLWGSGSGFGLVMNTGNGYTGIGTTPATRLDVAGLNNWDLTNTEGDMRIGNSNYRIKMGVALGGGGAGASGIMQTGGIGALSIGAGNKYQIQLNGAGNYVDFTNIAAGLRINGNAGTAGQVLTSGGSGAAPVWASGASVIAANSGVIAQTTTLSNFTGFIAVPGISQTVNTPAGRGMFIVKGQMVNNGCFACGLASCKYDIWIDGNLIDRSIIQVGNGLESVVTNGGTFYNLTAGSHTFAVYVDGNGNNYTAYGFRLVYLVLPQ